jgi:hypothetical protein
VIKCNLVIFICGYIWFLTFSDKLRISFLVFPTGTHWITVEENSPLTARVVLFGLRGRLLESVPDVRAFPVKKIQYMLTFT